MSRKARLWASYLCWRLCKCLKHAEMIRLLLMQLHEPCTRKHYPICLQDKLDGQDAVFWPERRYPWGVSEAFNPQHSDLLHLRLLLLKEACDELSAAKRARYHRTMKHYLQ